MNNQQPKTSKEVTQQWVDKKKAYELSQAKGNAKARLENLSSEEQTCLAVLKSLQDKYQPKTVAQMYQLLNTIEAE